MRTAIPIFSSPRRLGLSLPVGALLAALSLQGAEPDGRGAWLASVREAYGTAASVRPAEDAAGAVDGVTDGGFAFHTNQDASPWWQVDLGDSLQIGRVVIYGPHCPERLAGFQVRLSDDGQSWRTAYTHARPTKGQGVFTVPLAGERGRFVRILVPSSTWMHLAEVQVFGPNDTGTNLALRRPALQSSVSQWSTRSIKLAGDEDAWRRDGAAARRVIGRLAGYAGPRSRELLAEADRLAAAGGTVDADVWLALYGRAQAATTRWGKLTTQWKLLNAEALERALEDLIATFPTACPDPEGWRRRMAEVKATKVALDQGMAAGAEASWERARDIVAFQRQILLGSPVLDVTEILAVRRKAGVLGLPANWQSNSMLRKTGYDNDIIRFAVADPAGPIRTVYKPDDDTFVGDVDLHFDADRVLFSKSDPQGPWHVYEVAVDGSGFRRVTPEAEPVVNNYDACYLPDDRILYTSTAAMVAVPCVYGSTPVAHLFSLGRDGTPRQLTFDQEHAWCPTLLNDGRVLYLRWEYADLPHANSRILFHCNPDGTAQSEFYGSNSYWPNGVFYARPVPGVPNLVAGIVSGHHGVPRMGELVLFDPARGRQEATGVVQRLPGYGLPVEPLCRDQLVDASWPKFLHPYPLGRQDGTGSGKAFLVSAQPQAGARWGLYLVDVFDNLLLLREEDKHDLFEPIPLKPLPRPPSVAGKVDPERRDGLVYLADIGRGAGLKGVPAGEVKELRVFTYTYGYRGFGGLYGSIGMDGPWDCRRILGSVPVEPDGSALFRVPANTPLAVQPLDGEGKALQLMRSWFTVMPGETISCVGCHEKQNETAAPRATLAARGEPAAIRPWRGPVRNYAFRREVQPLLDRHCIRCHNGVTVSRGAPVFSLKDEPMRGPWTSKMSGHVSPAVGGQFSESYRALHRHVRHPGIESDMQMLAPMDYHADSSELMQILRKGHFDVALTAADFETIALWIDLNTPFHGEWSTIVGTEKACAAEGLRAEMRKRYANVEENHEQRPTDAATASPPVEPLAVVPTETYPSAGLPPASPVGAGAAAPAGQRQVIDLGGGVRIGFVYIPPGSFLMGNATGHPDEGPPHAVRLPKGFWMSQTEVTNRQFALFDPEHDSRRESKQGYQFGVKGYRLNTPAQPVVRVSWEAACRFAGWFAAQTGLAADIPTEEQWEYACRAGTGTPFAFGGLDEDFGPFANLADVTLRELASNPYTESSPIDDPPEFDDWVPKATGVTDGGLVSVPVGSYRPNPWGLHDMHGNVWEWTRSDFIPYKGSRARPDGPLTALRVVRGGSWRDRPIRCTASYRMAYRPYQSVYNVGFRLVINEDRAELTPKPQPARSVCERRRLVIADSGQRKLLRLSPEGEIEWELPDVYCYDLDVLADGHILFASSDEAGSRVVELGADGKPVWEYRSEGEVFSCQRLPNGTTLVGECTQARLVEVAPDGTVAATVPLTVAAPGHGALRWARKTPAATYLCAHFGERCVREYDRDGKVLRTLNCPYPVFGVAALDNGNVLVSTERALFEFDRRNRAVWHLFEDEIPGLRLRFLAGIRELPNGNILVCNWLGHGKEGDGEPLFELTRDKRIVWMYPDAKTTKWVACAGLMPVP